jgi:hypothetical protein
MPAVAIVAAMLVSSPPPVRDHFPEEQNPSQVLLVEDLRTGETIRRENAGAAEEIHFPLGESARLLFALAGLEERLLDPERTVPCDSLCWARGGHGLVDVSMAVAFSCDAYFRVLLPEIGGEPIRRHALRAGFGPDVPSATAIESADGFPGDGWSATARQWIEFWKGVPRGTLGLRSATMSALLAASGMAVSSPRGLARGLYDPVRRVRAAVGDTEEGAWVTGIRHLRGGGPWLFALHVRGATASLVTARADHILRETIRTWEHTSPNRVGRPLPPVTER